ncbi:MAG: ArsR family transcriptional regulator [Chloroflexi bacterium]|nr:ArsR family transcriptional regulator [Chloroflexota bacterium]
MMGHCLIYKENDVESTSNPLALSGLREEAERSLPEAPLSEEFAVALAELFGALADPNRAKIVHALAQSEKTTSGLAALLGMSPPAVSQHLRLLRFLRIVKPRREGRQVHYSLDDRHIRLLISLSITHLQEEHSRHGGLDDYDEENTSILNRDSD